MTKNNDSLGLSEPEQSENTKLNAAQLNATHPSSVHRFPATGGSFITYAAGVLISWIDEAHRVDCLAKLNLTAALASSLLLRNPPSVLICGGKICLDGDVQRTYSLLKRLPSEQEVAVVHIDQNDPLAGLCIDTTRLFAKQSRAFQLQDLLIICEINETLKLSDKPRRISNIAISEHTGISESQISRLRNKINDA